MAEGKDTADGGAKADRAAEAATEAASADGRKYIVQPRLAPAGGGYVAEDPETGEAVFSIERHQHRPFHWKLVRISTEEVEDTDRYRYDLFERHDMKPPVPETTPHPGAG